jgi:hypothetical protein
MSCADGCLKIDKIPEAQAMVEEADRGGGFVISHVGLWTPASGQMTAAEAESMLTMLHFWLGALRGAWTGPLFPQGLDANHEIVWQQFTALKLRASRRASTWLPEFHYPDLSVAFQSFTQKWAVATWHDALSTAIPWLVEVNMPGASYEGRIILCQVALELLSTALLVESEQHYHSRRDFESLSAAGRIRALLHHIGVPTALPDHLTTLRSLIDAEAFDGPGITTKVRNALAHVNERKQKLMRVISGEQRMECWQLANQYLDLAILAICDYDGYYSRRGWRGWKGDDEVLVPWSRR